MNSETTLRELKINESAVVVSVGGHGSLRQHLLDMGIIPGAEVKMIKLAPMGDPLEIRIDDYELTLRVSDAEQIEIRPVSESELKKITQSPKILKFLTPAWAKKENITSMIKMSRCLMELF